ncbi:MAG TPA: phytase [Steroidobacter sp.]
MRPLPLVACLLCALCGCQGKTDSRQGASTPVAVPFVRATEPTAFRQASDAAVWIDESAPQNSLLVLAAGEAGIELHDLEGKRLARFEGVETGFVDVLSASTLEPPLEGLVLASDQRLGAVRAYSLDATARTLEEITVQPLEVNDEITGLCSYVSPLTNQVYVYVATDQGQLEQWELIAQAESVAGRLVREIPAGKGAGHCVADDVNGHLYFSEESVGVWRIGAEPEADSSREVVDLLDPLGGLHEEVKGLAVYRIDRNTAYLVARDAGAASFNMYAIGGSDRKQFTISGDPEVGDVEGISIAVAPLGTQFLQGMLVLADEDAGDYKLVSLQQLGTSLGLDRGSTVVAEPQSRSRTVQPLVETEPVASFGDAADDPAIWVNPRNPARSFVIGTDKKQGLNVYDMQGKLVHSAPDGRMNNVDLRQGFKLGGTTITLVAATNRTNKSIALYRFDPSSPWLTSVADGVLETGLEDPYGLCMYHSRKTGTFYVLANDSADGKLRQWKLVERNGRVGIELVREIAVGSQAEGCVADDELGHLYVAEEDVGLWKYAAEPDGGDDRTSIDDVENGNLTDDVEGLAIWYGKNGTGYLVASNQGEDNYAVYRREGDNEYLGKFHVIANAAAGVDGASETDGLDVVSGALGPSFPDGLLVVQDGRNLMPSARQNFKYVSWRDVLQSLEPPERAHDSVSGDQRHATTTTRQTYAAH